MNPARKAFVLKLTATASGIVVILMILAWATSARIYASSIESAVQSGNLAILSHRIGAGGRTGSESMELIPPGLKVSTGEPISDDLRQKINASVKATVGGADPAFVEKMGNFLSGKGMVPNSLLAEMPRAMVAQRTPEFTGESGDTIDLYVMRIAFQQTGESISLVMERKGWFTWRVSKMSSSGGSVFWPVRPSN